MLKVKILFLGRFLCRRSFCLRYLIYAFDVSIPSPPKQQKQPPYRTSCHWSQAGVKAQVLVVRWWMSPDTSCCCKSQLFTEVYSLDLLHLAFQFLAEWVWWWYAWGVLYSFCCSIYQVHDTFKHTPNMLSDYYVRDMDRMQKFESNINQGRCMYCIGQVFSFVRLAGWFCLFNYCYNWIS